MDTKTALLDRAETLARSRGFDAFSYADLALALGIKKASVHYHYPAKADLAFSLVDRYSSRFADDLGAIAAEPGTAGEKLLRYIGLYRAALNGGDALCLCVAFTAGRNSLADGVLAELDGFFDHSRQWLTTRFADARADKSVCDIRDPAEEAVALLAQVQGAQLLARAAQNPDRFDDALAAFKARLSP